MKLILLYYWSIETVNVNRNQHECKAKEYENSRNRMTSILIAV